MSRSAEIVGTALAVPLAAQVACGPVVVLLAPAVSLVAVPANLVAGPLVAPATLLGVLAGVLSLWWPSGAALVGGVAALPAWGIAAVARTADRVPGGALPWPAGVAGALLLAALTAGALLVRTRRGRQAVALLILAAVVAGSPGGAAWVRSWVWRAADVAVGRQWPPDGWVMVACDVGQGDALLLATGPGRAVVVDAGPDPVLVDRCLRRYDVRVVDAVVLTHFHSDHVDGLPGVLRGRRVGPVLVSIVAEPAAAAARVSAQAAAAGVPVMPVRAGQSLRWGRVDAEVLWPHRRIDEGSVPNNASVVLLVRTVGARLLLLGDVEPAAARAVATRLGGPASTRVDVLKVAHHGSALQDDDLVLRARPALAVISVGRDNEYGHPAPSLLRLLSRSGARVARTDTAGDVVVVVEDGALGVVGRRR